MTSKSLIKFEPRTVKPWDKRLLKYLGLGLFLLVLLVCCTLAYLSLPERYRSTMSIVVPGSSSSSNFNIENVGQANQQTNVALDGKGYSPLINYKYILGSKRVLEAAARELNVSSTKGIKPKIKLVQQSSIINISSDAQSPDMAQKAVWAIYKAFKSSLTQLRSDEMLMKDTSIKEALEQYRLRVAETRSALVRFQEQSIIISEEQVKQAINTLGELKSDLANKESFRKNMQGFVRQLGIDLGISPNLAGQALLIQSDAASRGYLTELNDSAALSAQYLSRWGEKHPKVIAEKSRYAVALASLEQRSSIILGKPVSDRLYAMNLQFSMERASLFKELLNAYAKLQGLESEIRELKSLMESFQDRLRIFARESAELAHLQREHDLAEAVYTSAAARLEAGKSDAFASYPVVQVLYKPSYPQKARSPNKSLAIIGFVIGFIFITIGLVLLWQRNYFVNQLLKKS